MADSTADSRTGLLEDLVARCLERLPEEGEAAISEICREHPSLAGRVLHRLDVLGRMGLVTDLAQHAPHAAVPDRLGPFRLGRLLGGGGMGVVYEAEQDDLGRTVALKLIRPENLFFPGARARFRREIEAVSKLQHPGIVPVYTVGEASNVPYFAMELIRGCSLSEVIAELGDRPVDKLRGHDLAAAVRACVQRRHPDSEPEPSATDAIFEGTWVEASVRITQQVAYALEHAHARGVIHRDVKPSNIMLTESGRALVLDFGVARSHGASNLTRSGSTVGSLPYIAPEQLRRESIDHRVDIYSLGVTLWELLTLTQPFLQDSEEDTRANILAGERPRLRSLNAAVPWDTETVTTVAMDTVASRRYLTAADFARDLDNLVLRRPITARRPGPLLRARRWIERHPTVSVSAVLALVLIAAASIGFWWLEHDARVRVGRENERVIEARKVAEEREAEAVAASRRANARQSTSDRALQFLVDLFSHAEPGTANGEMLTARAMVDRGVERIAELDDEPDIQLPLLTALGRARLGLGDRRGATALIARACAIADRPRRPADAYAVDAWLGQAAVDRYERRPDGALERLARASNALDALPEGAPNRARRRRELEESRALALMEVERYREAEGLLEELIGDLPASERTLPRGLELRATMADVLLLQVRLGEAQGLLEELEAEWDEFIENEHPGRAYVLSMLGAVRASRNQLRSAEQAFQDAKREYEALELTSHPGYAQVLLELGVIFASYQYRGIKPKEYGGRAERLLQQSVQLFDQLGTVDVATARARAWLGRVLTVMKRHTEAVPNLDAVLDDPQSLLRSRPVGFALARAARAECWWELGGDGRKRAISEMRAVIQSLQSRLKGVGEDGPGVDAAVIARLGGVLAKWLRKEGDTDAAEATFRDLATTYIENGGPKHAAVIRPAWSAGRLAFERDAYADAVPWLERALVAGRAAMPGSPLVGWIASHLGEALAAQGGGERAEKLLIEGWEILARRPRLNRSERTVALERVVAYYTKRGDTKRAAAFRARAGE